MSEHQARLIKLGTHQFIKNMLRSMTLLLTLPFVVFFFGLEIFRRCVHGRLGDEPFNYRCSNCF